MKKVFATIPYVIEKNKDAMLVTIIDEEGSSPRGIGSQMLVAASGQLCGTIGGGTIEKLATERAMNLIRDKRSEVHEYSLRKGGADETGMICGGDVTVYFQYIDANDEKWAELCSMLVEHIETRQKGWLVQFLDGRIPVLIDESISNSVELDCVCSDMFADGCVTTDKVFIEALPIGERAVVFGGGHCGLALSKVLESVGFRVTIVDDREDYITKERYPMATERICCEYSHLQDYITITEEDYVVVMTTGHKHDYEVEEQILKGNFAYLGVIGSKAKTALVNQRLLDGGYSSADIARIHAPVGLKIGAVTPAEIAISIAAEMIQVRASCRKIQGKASGVCPVG